MKDDIDKIPEEFTEDYFKVDSLKDKKESKMKRFLTWFVTSSVDRNRLSLTIKALIPFLVLTGISDTETLESLAGSVGDLLVNVAEFVSGALTAFGLLRKIWYSFER